LGLLQRAVREIAEKGLVVVGVGDGFQVVLVVVRRNEVPGVVCLRLVVSALRHAKEELLPI
jgi:phosphoribosylformylglycinamidine (FGAM) synthase-like amidotransferase family enzyme